MAIRQTFSVSFYCRESKKDKKGLAPIEVSISINGERKFLKLQRKEYPSEFAKAMRSKRDNEIKLFCENQRFFINRIMEDMQFADIELTATNLKECFKKGGVTNYYTLGQLWSDTIQNKREEQKSGSLGGDTFNRYTLAKNAFYAANAFDDSTPAKNVDLQHIHNFQHYLINTLKLSQGSAYNYHARVKAAFTYAFNRGKIKANPYGVYRIDKGEKKEMVFLDEQEIERIKNKELIGRLDKIRDLFLFQCFSGLSYSDMALLQPEDFKKNEKGQVYIQKKRKKTGQVFKSVVLKEGVEILNKYNNSLPIVSNVKLNAYLKEIQDLCQIEKSLHTHLGRTTYICYLYNKKVPIDIIAELVGHSSCHTTLKYYAKMQPDTVLETLGELNIAERTDDRQRSEVDPVLSPESEERKKKRTEEKKKKSEAISKVLMSKGIDID